MSNADRNRKILVLCGKKSYGLIAQEFGISRNVVAGVMARARRDTHQRTADGHHGCGDYAKKTLPLLGRRAKANAGAAA